MSWLDIFNKEKVNKKLDEQPEIIIINKVLEGDKAQFAKILERYEAPILRYTLRLLSFNQQDAEDITAQTFVKAYVNLASYNQNLKFSSWLYRIAHNEAINLIKKNSKLTIIDPEKIEIPVFDKLDFQKKDQVESLLSLLKSTDREILTLFYLQELSVLEIAQILKTSTGSVKVKLSRARNRAKSLISKTS